jgi:PqqD family protein of HPr-rel-A system
VSRYILGEGSRVEGLGGGWVAYSALSGETLVLNTEAAAVLEILSEGPQDELGVGRALAAQAGMPVERVCEHLQDGWSGLLSAGLIRRLDEPADNAM